MFSKVARVKACPVRRDLDNSATAEGDAGGGRRRREEWLSLEGTFPAEVESGGIAPTGGGVAWG